MKEGFSKTPEWSDVALIPQTDTVDDSVARIAYSPSYVETTSALRGISAIGELSARALELTKAIVLENPAHYTAWSYRRRVLFSSNDFDLNDEVDFVTEIGLESPKNYQLWYHRKCLVEKTKNFKREIEFTKIVLDGDAKNYHAWSHRQHALLGASIDFTESELNFVENLLDDDVRNNSAWNQRWFVARNSESFDASNEAKFAIDASKKAPKNESPASYLEWLSRIDEKAKSFALDYVRNVNDAKESVALLSLAVELGESNALDDLIRLDPIRRAYWTNRKNERGRNV